MRHFSVKSGKVQKLTNAVAENRAYNLPVMDSFAEACGANDGVVADGTRSNGLGCIGG